MRTRRGLCMRVAITLLTVHLTLCHAARGAGPAQPLPAGTDHANSARHSKRGRRQPVLPGTGQRTSDAGQRLGTRPAPGTVLRARHHRSDHADLRRRRPDSQVASLRRALVRGTPGGANEVMSVNIKRFLKTGDKRLIPSLKPEDTVIVGRLHLAAFRRHHAGDRRPRAGGQRLLPLRHPPVGSTPPVDGPTPPGGVEISTSSEGVREGGNFLFPHRRRRREFPPLQWGDEGGYTPQSPPAFPPVDGPTPPGGVEISTSSEGVRGISALL